MITAEDLHAAADIIATLDEVNHGRRIGLPFEELASQSSSIAADDLAAKIIEVAIDGDNRYLEVLIQDASWEIVRSDLLRVDDTGLLPDIRLRVDGQDWYFAQASSDTSGRLRLTFDHTEPASR